MVEFLLGISLGASVSWLVCTYYWEKQYSKMSNLCGSAIEYCGNVVNDLKDMRQVNELQAATIDTQKELIKLLEAKIERDKNLPDLLNEVKNEQKN